MKTEYREYEPKRILNRYKHTGGPWFWIRYTAYPYIGCEHACEYCYTVMDKYCQFDEPDDFCRIIKVKTNAPALLRKELAKVPCEGIGVGDYQPTEKSYKLSRQMLEVVRDLGFPALLLEKSDLVLRDTDILKQINKRTEACVAFSIITTDDKLARRVEPRADPPSRRFAAIRVLSDAGIPAGVCQMPILPSISDDEATLEAVVRATAENGGTFVLAGGLTLNDNCGVRFRKFIAREFPELLSTYKTYTWTEQKFGKYWTPIAKNITRLCDKYGIRDSIPRYIPDNKSKHNKRVSEILFHITKLLENLGENSHRVWAFRKAAWAIDDLEFDVHLANESGTLAQIENVGKGIAPVIREILETGESSLHRSLATEWRS